MSMSKRSAVGQLSQIGRLQGQAGCVYPRAGGGEGGSGSVDRVGISFIITLWYG